MIRRAHILFAGLSVALLAQTTVPPRPSRGSGGSGSPPPGWGGWGNENDLGGSLVRTEGSGVIDEDLVKTAREVASHSTGTPEWTNPRGFEKDVFTFCRAIFKVDPTSSPRPSFHRGRRLGWWVDFPDADLNLSYRLQQMTSMRTDPDGRVLKLSDPELHNYPFLLMEHPGYMKLRPTEVAGLRKYLLAGGVLAVIDFWNIIEWRGFAEQMKHVLPEREWTDLTFDHPLFHSVFDLKGPMQGIQVPTMQFWNRNHDPKDPSSPIQVDRGEGSQQVSVRALHDDKGRIMVIAFHNTDITDGWEREGEQPDYFAVFSERIAYPIGVNLVFYLMTH
ncbi:MAG: DUF4159 domain-containing protein [Opitutaceae bacterium]|nr:DUF4159 domain-containing protein [Opitutaceae bacterium]